MVDRRHPGRERLRRMFAGITRGWTVTRIDSFRQYVTAALREQERFSLEIAAMERDRMDREAAAAIDQGRALRRAREEL